MNLWRRYRQAQLQRRQAAAQTPNAPPSAEAAPATAIRHHRASRLDNEAASHQTTNSPTPDYAEANYNLGNLLADNGKLEEAVASYRIAIAARPGYARAHSKLGIALKAQGKLDKAVASYRTAIALDPDHAEAHRSLGYALGLQGKVDEARACLRRSIEINPDHVGGRCSYARFYRFLPGDPEIDKLERMLARENISDDNKIRVCFALGKAHDDIGRYAEAFSYYSAANKKLRRRGTFKAYRHRKRIAKIKKVFPERSEFVGRDVTEARHVPVFVVGMSRSGKTLVESLLSQHEDVHGAGESKEWSIAIKAVLDKRAIRKPFPRYVRLLTADHIKEIGRKYMDALIKDSPESRLFINTLPGHYQFIGMILQALPTAKIIYCRRDPTDNCLFVYFRQYTHRNEHSNSLSKLALYYSNYRDLMGHWTGLYPDRIFSVRYEDLVRHTTDVGARIFEFCGLDYDPATIKNAFRTDGIGHWKYYEPYLHKLRRALNELAPDSNGIHRNQQ